MHSSVLTPMLWALAAAAVLLPGAGAAREEDSREGLRVAVERLRYNGNAAASGIHAPNLVAEFYERRDFAPAWRDAAKVQALLALVADSRADGLAPGDYHEAELSRMSRELTGESTPAERSAFELEATDALMSLVHHQRLGKTNPRDQHRSWNSRVPRAEVDTLTAVEEAMAAPSLAAAVAARLPREPWYLRLREALARYRRIEAAGGWPLIAQGPSLEAGTDDPRVPALASRLAITGDLREADGETRSGVMDATLAQAVQRFQARHGLETDGVVGPATLRALNTPVGQRVQQLRLALERARWVQDDLGDRFIAVNIAGFRIYAVARRKLVWESRVVVGKAHQQTPVFSGELEYIVFNPSWSVPYSIATRELLPEIQARPDWFDTHRYEVRDLAGARIDPATVDWSTQSRARFEYVLVQPPGPDNALGRVKFIFPNEHAVYLHDTPARDLFRTAERAFSHGCIRVEDPLALAALLLEGEGWDRSRVEAVTAAGRTSTVYLAQPMPILLLYSTATVDPDGTVHFHRDIYERDARVAEALDGPFRIP